LRHQNRLKRSFNQNQGKLMTWLGQNYDSWIELKFK
jgi:hypothetical protein